MPSMRTAGLEIDHDAGPPDGPVVLLLHGWPDDRSGWRPVLAALDVAEG